MKKVLEDVWECELEKAMRDVVNEVRVPSLLGQLSLYHTVPYYSLSKFLSNKIYQDISFK